MTSDLDSLRDLSKRWKKLSQKIDKIAKNDISFYKTIDSNIADKVANTSSELLKAVNVTIQAVDGSCAPIENATEDWRKLGNVFDGLYEKLDIGFDNLNSQKKTSSMVYMESTQQSVKDIRPQKRMEKPQLQFKVAVDNSESHPFKPKLVTKPHALRPLNLELVDNHYEQPYEYEIDQQEYPAEALEASEPIPSKPWTESQEPVWIDTVEKLVEMVAILRQSSAIAVDLEHHDLRTYYGIVCLMQISSRNQDWLIDTVALRDDLTILNEIFTDPAIVKVFHGAFMDIIWLQRDLGLYVVSLFDTFHASKQLGFPKHSLAYLLERFANFKTNKKYQLADWRVRPLSPAMKLYARADTHFLLNIYDQLRNMLIAKKCLHVVFHESRKVARRRFEYYSFRPEPPSSNVAVSISDRIEPWRNIMNKFNVSLTKKSLIIALYNWRDSVSRRDDESHHYVMPNHLLVSLALSAPTDVAGVLSASDYITDHVRANAKEIAALIVKTQQESRNEDLELLNSVSLELDKTDKEITDRIVNQSISNFNRSTKLFSSATKSLIYEQPHVEETKVFVSRSSVWAVKPLSNDKVAQLSLQEIVSRFMPLYNALSADKGSVPQTLAVTQPLTSSSASNLATNSEPETKTEAGSLNKKEDRNEIVVLKKSTTRPKHRVKVNTNNDDNVVDYTSAEKIIVDEVNDRKSRKKKRAFDPYAQSNNSDHKPKKKRAIGGNEKSISYK